MAAIRPDVHPTATLDQRLRQLGTTIRWAPAPLWGTSTSEHARYAVYLAGSIVGWTLAGLAMAAIVGRALGLLG
jgi:hypothetical protein